MIKENKLISRAVSVISNGITSRNDKKASVLSWNLSPDKEGAMGYVKTENDHLKNEMYLWCHLLFKPLNAQNMQYRLCVLPVFYILRSETASIKLTGGFYYNLNLSKPVEWDDLEKKIKRTDLLRVIKDALLAFQKDHEELKKDHELLKDLSFTLPPDTELVKCIDYKGKNKPWEYKYQTKH